MPRIRHTVAARRDLLDIWRGIARYNPSAADRGDARMVVEHPYVILYRTIAHGVQIVRVLHGARDIGSDLFAEGIE